MLRRYARFTMPCCQGQDYDRFFDADAARKEQRRYQRRGARGATARLVAALVARANGSETLLDIGGGAGVISQEMLKAGCATQVTSVDASTAYLEAQSTAARRHGYEDRWHGIVGDFVDVADQVPDADVVTLDKVICCYPDMSALVQRSASKAKQLYGIVVPQDGWWMREVVRVANTGLRMFRYEFRGFVHRLADVDAVIRHAGLEMVDTSAYWLWSVRVYERK